MSETPMTPERLTEIAARAAAATPGPWGFYDGDTYADVAADLEQTSRGSYSYRQKIAQLEDENYWDDPAHEEHDEERAPEQMAANAAFIAHAREDVPALLARVAELEAERHTTNEALSEAAEALRRQRDRIDQLETQRKALRAPHVRFADSDHCQHDGERWPCPTVAVLGDDEQSVAKGGDAR